MLMEITFDTAKRDTNKAKHGFDFADLDMAFLEASIALPAKGDRMMAIGWFQGAIIVAVVFRPLGSEALSVISMRRASRKERMVLE